MKCTRAGCENKNAKERGYVGDVFVVLCPRCHRNITRYIRHLREFNKYKYYAMKWQQTNRQESFEMYFDQYIYYIDRLFENVMNWLSKPPESPTSDI